MASALTAGVGDFKQFKGGHQLGAWLGLVPSQNSSGGKARLGRITKRGDDYLTHMRLQQPHVPHQHVAREVGAQRQHLFQQHGDRPDTAPADAHADVRDEP